MLLTIKSYLGSSVARNAGALYLIQIANYLLPLITVPYVLRVLNPSGYGLVAFGKSFVAYFDLFIDYGFSLSATRKISVARHDPMAVSRTVFNVWAPKLILLLTGFLVLLLLVKVVPTLRQNKILLFIIYGPTLGSVLFLAWLSQGMERMVQISVINLLIRLLVVVGIFTLINRPEDYFIRQPGQPWAPWLRVWWERLGPFTCLSYTRRFPPPLRSGRHSKKVGCSFPHITEISEVPFKND